MSTKRQMDLYESKTNNGLDFISFKDDYGNLCSLQESSLATEDAVWLGVDESRMHLTRKQVKVLLPFLERFVKTGDLTKDKILVTLTAEKNLPDNTALALVAMIEAAKKFLKTTNQNQKTQ